METKNIEATNTEVEFTETQQEVEAEETVVQNVKTLHNEEDFGNEEYFEEEVCFEEETKGKGVKGVATKATAVLGVGISGFILGKIHEMRTQDIVTKEYSDYVNKLNNSIIDQSINGGKEELIETINKGLFEEEIIKLSEAKLTLKEFSNDVVEKIAEDLNKGALSKINIFKNKREKRNVELYKQLSALALTIDTIISRYQNAVLEQEEQEQEQEE